MSHDHCCCHEHDHDCHQSHCTCHAHDHDRDDALLLPRLGVAAMLAAAGLIAGGTAGAVLLTLAWLAAGYDILWHAVRNIRRGEVFDEHFLMSVASLGALLLGEYAEGAAVMILYQAGEWLQERAVRRSRASITALMDMRPDRAEVLRGGETVSAAPEEVAAGEEIIVRPGARIPLDGVVLTGTSAVDTSALTGESLPRSVQPGDSVLSGCVNGAGLLTVRVTAAWHDSAAARIIDMVEQAGERKARTERFITRFARIYTPLVCLAALLAAVIPPLFDGQWPVWIRRALTFLVISCPCALVISVPLTFCSGISRASRRGVLVKGADFLERLAALDTVVFDKTGTLTQGGFTVTAVRPSGCTAEYLLETAALAESRSTHPLAAAILTAWGGEPDATRLTDVTETPGLGVAALIDGAQVYAGNPRLMASLGLTVPQDVSGTAVHVAVDGAYRGYIQLADALKPDAEDALRSLRTLGVKHMVLLTGDHAAAAQPVTDALGLDEVHAQLLPADKAARLEALLGRGCTAFVGDGVNDAPVLRLADVGMAMGALGSDAAVEAADVVIMDDDLRRLPDAVRLARRTRRIARQNIAFALGVKLLVMLLGLLGLTNLWIAVFADVGVALLAALNAVR